MKKFLCLLMALVLSLVVLSACKADDNQGATEEATISDDEITASIVGRWMGGEDGARIGYQFNADGTGLAAIFPMTYTVENGVITVTISAFGETKTGSGLYDVDGDSLAITNDDGETYVLTRYTE